MQDVELHELHGVFHAGRTPTGACVDASPSSFGALAIPRYKVWTIVHAMQDVELHELHGVFHAGRTPTGACVDARWPGDP